MLENIVVHEASCSLPTKWATFELHAFTDKSSGKEHLALTLGTFNRETPCLVRIHSECMTGDTLFSLRCDYGPQLEAALEKIANAGQGILLYLRQEGRGIGLVNKIKAYKLQENGADTVQANRMLGLADDLRSYEVCKAMLDYFNVNTVNLLSNNPEKVKALKELGFTVKRHEHSVGKNVFNQDYLKTKENKMGHLIGLKEDMAHS